MTDTILKIVLSTTPIYGIVFLFRILSANKFDKLFLMKHQKYLYTAVTYTILFMLFVVYGVVLTSLFYSMPSTCLETFQTVILFIYLLLLILNIVLFLLKLLYQYFKKQLFPIKKKVVNIAFYPTVVFNLLIYSMLLFDALFKSKSTTISKVTELGNHSITYFVIMVILFKSNLFFLGFRKKEWNYVLSPLPEDIEKRHLFVLYSLNQNTLVLSESPKENLEPSTVYLFDLNKQSYLCFNRVLNLTRK